MNSKSYNFNFGWKWYEGTPPMNDELEIGYDIGNAPIMRKWTKATSFDYALPGYNDETWTSVQLPHDFVIEKSSFSNKVQFQTGSLERGAVWYRKDFKLPENCENSRVFLQFNGIYRDCQVWVNGDIMKRQLGGFMGFRTEISEAVNYDSESSVAVYCDARESESWWYPGGGIYRDVSLHILPKVCFAENGLYVKTKNVDLETKNCDFEVQFEVDNVNPESYDFECEIELYDDDTCVNKTNYVGNIGSIENKLYCTPISIENAMLWSTENPHLYKAVVKLKTEFGTHTEEVKFAPRKIEYNSATGMKLNGEPIFVKGVCGHDDFAGVGVALNRSIIEYKIDTLKKMGINGYRCSHNPPDPIFLDVCDEKGILVMDENRWPAVSEIAMDLFVDMVKRDRNHPCVFLWSFGNEEESLQGKDKGLRVLTKMKNFGQKYDDTREYMLAINAMYLPAIQKHEEMGMKYKVNGVNYMMMRDFESPKKLHKAFPDMVFFNTEIASVYNTRVYKMHEESRLDKVSSVNAKTAVWMCEENRGNVTCYGDSHPKWGMNIEEALKAYEGQTHMCGMFLWTGMDYRGETSPYKFPNVVSSYGFIDLCGFFKPWANYLKCYWTDEKFISLMPLSWNLFEKEGTVVKVYALSNSTEVELFLNGKSLGKQTKQPLDRGFWEVPYEKGELIAVAYENGTEIARCSLKTSDKEYKIKLSTEKTTLKSDSSDSTIIVVDVLDENGVEVTDSEIQVDFSIVGNGKIIGTGNGNHMSLEHDKKPSRKLHGGKAIVIVQSTFETGNITVKATSDNVISDEIEINVVASEKINLI